MDRDRAVISHAVVIPKIDDSAFVAESAYVCGDVHIGEQASIWFGSVLRGDVQAITVGARTNVQDGTIIHASTGGPPTVIGADVTIGHRAVLHGCTVEDKAFIGIGAIVLDRAVVRRNAMLAAGAVLTPGKVIEANELWAGNPARFVRKLTEQDIENMYLNTQRYVALGKQYHRGGVPIFKGGKS
jgi:carbonic anhydrase/acetyltransferase-like protein (isoleucine patch superfamily)